MTSAATADEAVLSNAVWYSLRGAHAHLAEPPSTTGGNAGRGPAAGALRYRGDVSVFHAAPDDSDDSWTALAGLADGRWLVLFRELPITPPADWEVRFRGTGRQMVLDEPLPATVPDRPDITVRDLGDDDVGAMLTLVELTEPGPFAPRTIELGGYVGVFHGDELVAMAGQRLQPPGWCEISAVCTHPAARRQGYASALTSIVASRAQARGDRVLLHVAADNHAARLAYERLGFRVRTTVGYAVTRPQVERPAVDRPTGEAAYDRR